MCTNDILQSMRSRQELASQNADPKSVFWLIELQEAGTYIDEPTVRNVEATSTRSW